LRRGFLRIASSPIVHFRQDTMLCMSTHRPEAGERVVSYLLNKVVRITDKLTVSTVVDLTKYVPL
jgi:hypothetical protein